MLLSVIILITSIRDVDSIDIVRNRRGTNNKQCAQTSAAKDLFQLLDEIKTEYYTLQPYLISTNLELSASDVKELYKPYDPSPKSLKTKSIKAKTLLEKLNNLKINHSELKPREERLIHQFRYLLQSNFDNIYENYFDGVWMLGPDYFCEQPICSALDYFHQALSRMASAIRTLEDLEKLISLVRDHRKPYEQYLQNVKAGVKSGMVWSKEVCKASSKTFRKFNRAASKDPEGVLKMRFARFLASIPYNVNSLEEWKRNHNKSFNYSLTNEIIESIGKPLHNLTRYLKDYHIKNCPPSDVASGLGQLPLDYVYLDEKKTNEKTTKKLPESDKEIDVKEGYIKFLKYYTSGNSTGEEASKLGYRRLKEYNIEVEQLAIDITGKLTKKEAVEELKRLTKKNEQFINKKAFPENESNDVAHEMCDNDEDAQKYCPERWKAYEQWKQRNVDIMREAKPYLKNFFHQNGDKKTTPNCTVSIVADYDPTNGVPSYLESDPDCSEPAQYFLPFFKDKMGPVYDDYNTNFHEARPGHHLQIQGYLENFMDECEDISMWLNNLVDYYPAFSEGWGLYAENPLLLREVMDSIMKNKDEKTKNDKQKENLSKYGALKWQIWRALRLVVDVGFHQQQMTRKEALELFINYTWDDSDTVHKELTRYQGTPGQATSYMLGQQTILDLRQMTNKALAEKFDVKDFHYELLSVGQAPFDYVKLHIKNYISCTQDSNSLCDLKLGKEKSSRKRGLVATDSVIERRQRKLMTFLKRTRRKKHL